MKSINEFNLSINLYSSFFKQSFYKVLNIHTMQTTVDGCRNGFWCGGGGGARTGGEGGGVRQEWRLVEVGAGVEAGKGGGGSRPGKARQGNLCFV